MTDLEAMKRMQLISNGGTNFSEESQAACKIALEALQERRTLEAEVHSYKAMLETAKEYIAKQKDELEQMKRERDAAVRDLKTVTYDEGEGCDYCANCPCAPENDRCIGWKWRGVKEETT